MLSETAKYQAEVSAESNRLIKQGVPPWEAAMQAGKNVQQKRKLTKRATDAEDSAASQAVSNAETLSNSDGSAVPTPAQVAQTVSRLRKERVF